MRSKTHLSHYPSGCHPRNARVCYGFAFLTECVQEAPSAGVPDTGNCINPINAFLTLTAVTKW